MAPSPRSIKSNSLKRWGFWASIGILLGAMFAVEVKTSSLETATWDEGIHLVAGYTYLKTGDFRIDPEHPPLGRMLEALPLLPMDPHPFLEEGAWDRAEFLPLARQFLYHNRYSADDILFRARLATIVLTLGLGLVIAVFVRRHFGDVAALMAVLLYSLDPGIIAHGRYATTDFVATCLIFVTSVAWVRYLRTGGRWDLLWAGLALGSALASKHSALFLLGVFPLTYLIRIAQQRWAKDHKGQPEARLTAFGLARSFVCVLVLAGAVVTISYGPESGRVLRDWAQGKAQPLRQVVDKSTAIGKVLAIAGRNLHLPAHRYLVGINTVAEHDKNGHDSYLLGEVTKQGRWYYFPVVFLVKTPLAVLILCALCLPVIGMLVWQNRGPRLREALCSIPAAWMVPAVAFVLYWEMSITTNINLGLRHILPTYPLLYVLLAATLAGYGATCYKKAFVALVVLASGLMLYESASIYPDYLAFFNIAVGGPGNGPRYLVDSNIDWGQDVKKLKQYLDAHKIPRACICYFGSVNLKYYGVDDPYLPRTNETEARQHLECEYGAISVTPLMDVYLKPGDFAWLREKTPIAKVGYSIYVYDLRKKN